MNIDYYILGAILILALMNFSFRALPFLFGKQLKRFPAIYKIEKQLPPVILLLLVLQTLSTLDHGITHIHYPEVIALLAVVILQAYKRNVSISTFVGGAIYIILNYM